MYANSLETETERKKSEFVRLDRSSYDELTHRMRHLQTLAKVFLVRTDRLEKVISDLSIELSEKRKEILNKIGALDEILSTIEGKPIFCGDCLSRGKCDVPYTNNGNNQT